MKKIVLISIIALLGGCSIPMKSYAPQNAPTQYKEGFNDGCDSGYVAAGNPYYKYKKDIIRSQSDQLYKDGWVDGMNMCKSKYENMSRSIGY